MSVFGEKNTYSGIPQMMMKIPMILMNRAVDPRRYIVIRYRQITIPAMGRIRCPWSFFVCFRFPRTSNARHVRRNANARLNTENEIKSERPEKIHSTKAMMPCRSSAMYGV